jgi:hypothetical protein
VSGKNAFFVLSHPPFFTCQTIIQILTSKVAVHLLPPFFFGNDSLSFTNTPSIPNYKAFQKNLENQSILSLTKIYRKKYKDL